MAGCDATKSDYEWLCSSAGQPWLDAAANHNGSLAAITTRLRQTLSPDQVSLVLGQADLRRRATAKFSRAESMLFTSKGLEQATDETLAGYKSTLLPKGADVADLCCGIGGDAIGFGGGSSGSFGGGLLGARVAQTQSRQVVAVDLDPICCTLAAYNAAAYGLQFATLAQDVESIPLEDFAAWHIDPDRRASGARTTTLSLHQPDEAALRRLVARNGNALFKLAPATDVPPDWAQAAQLEWLGSHRECKQLLVRFGNCAEAVGQRTATVIESNVKSESNGDSPGRATSFCGDAHVVLNSTGRLQAYLFEPHAAVRAAGLTNALAEAHGWHRLAARAAYLVGDQPAHSPLWATFEVIDSMPLDRKSIKATLRQRKMGRLEIKARGTGLDPAVLAKKLRVDGDEAATLLVYPREKSLLAVLARRVTAK